MVHTSSKLCLCTVAFLIGCSSAPKKSDLAQTPTAKEKALQFLNETIKPLPKATISSSNDVDWPVGAIPWNRYTLPTFAPNGLHASVQLSSTPPRSVLAGRTNEPQEDAVVYICPLDPVNGNTLRQTEIKEGGVLLTAAANDAGVLVEKPLGELGRWIGFAEYETGQVEWLIADDSINMSPTITLSGNMAWSRRTTDDDRFHLVVHSERGQFVIDDGESDWLYPHFVNDNTLRAFKLHDHALHIVEFDVMTENPLLTSLEMILMPSLATRQHALQIATTTPRTTGQSSHAYFLPLQGRMATWNPQKSESPLLFKAGSIAAVPASDGTWIVTLNDRVLRQYEGQHDGVHLRNLSAIPVSTSSRQWTHYMLIPDGTRLQVRAMSFSR